MNSKLVLLHQNRRNNKIVTFSVANHIPEFFRLPSEVRRDKVYDVTPDVIFPLKGTHLKFVLADFLILICGRKED